MTKWGPSWRRQALTGRDDRTSWTGETGEKGSRGTLRRPSSQFANSCPKLQ